MKKLTLTLSFAIIASNIFLNHSAEALTFLPAPSLSAQSVSQTSMTLAVIPSDYFPGLSSAINNHRQVFLNYRTTMCGDDPATAPIVNCPAMYQMPTKISFGYSPNPTPTLLPIYLTNLNPNTSYTFWLSYDTGIVCITTPCPSTTEDFDHRILVTTQGGQQGTQQTQLQFSNIGNSSVTVKAAIGNDAYQQYVQQRLNLSIRYIPDTVSYSNTAYASAPNYLTQNFIYSDDIFSPLPLYLNNLQPNTQYRAWIGYWPAPQPCNGYCTLTVPGPIYSDTSWTFTTTGGTNNVGPLTQKLTIGMKSEQVRTLQWFLMTQGYLNSYDGKFGPITERAVRQFQADHYLSVDGRVGPNTRSVLNRLINEYKPATYISY